MLNIIFSDILLDQMDEEVLVTRIKPLVEQHYKQVSDHTFMAEDDSLLVLGFFDAKGEDTFLTIERVTSLDFVDKTLHIEQIMELADSELSFMEKKAIEAAKKHT